MLLGGVLGVVAVGGVVVHVQLVRHRHHPGSADRRGQPLCPRADTSSVRGGCRPGQQIRVSSQSLRRAHAKGVWSQELLQIRVRHTGCAGQYTATLRAFASYRARCHMYSFKRNERLAPLVASVSTIIS